MVEALTYPLPVVIIAEIIGVPYIEIVKVAFIPAILSYTAIFSIVHIEAVKENIRGLTPEECPPMMKTLVSGLHFLIPLILLIWLLLVVMWTPTTAASWSILAACVVATILYVIMFPFYNR